MKEIKEKCICQSGNSMRAGSALDRLDWEIPTRTIDSTILTVPPCGESHRSFASGSPEETRRDVHGGEDCALAYRVAVAINHKPYWSRCIYIPSSVPAR